MHDIGHRTADQPSSYRIYDYLLGGSFNLAVDRAFAHELLTRVPWARDVARANRQFLIRAVRLAVSLGIRQFLDLGSGIISASRVDRAPRHSTSAAGSPTWTPIPSRSPTPRS